jgi:hypothetical protein
MPELAQGIDLGMRRGVLAGPNSVVGPGENFALTHNHTAKRSLPQAGLFEGKVKKGFVSRHEEEGEDGKK